MWTDSGWWDKKSRMRQPSWMLVLGLGRRLCTKSTNWMPSLMKNTCSAEEHLLSVRALDALIEGCGLSSATLRVVVVSALKQLPAEGARRC